jgi:hypothetical protein
MSKKLEMSFLPTFSQHCVSQHNGRHRIRPTTPIQTAPLKKNYLDTYTTHYYTQFCNNPSVINGSDL